MPCSKISVPSEIDLDKLRQKIYHIKASDQLDSIDTSAAKNHQPALDDPCGEESSIHADRA